jgi:type IV pilus assembly protein PilB
MSAVKKGLGELLVRENLVNIDQIEAARKEQKSSGGRLGSALVKLGFVNDKKMAEFLAKQYNVPDIDLDQFEVDPEALKTLPVEVCQKHCVIPVSKADNVLVVAFADPSNIFVRDDLSFVSKCKIEVVVAPEIAIQKAIEKNYAKGKTDLGQIATELENTEEAFTFSTSNSAQLLDGANDAELGPIVKFVNVMLTEAIKLKASDIHIEPYEKRLRVRYRIDGLLHEKSQPPSGVATGLSSRIKIMAKLDIAERRKPQDGRIKVKASNGMDVDLRVSVLPTVFGEKIVMRLLDKSNLKLDMTQLGFDAEDLAIFKEKINESQGMVLVTGPTGSGKTTTLYSAIATVNDPQMNVCTAEDPVEFNLDGINQVHVHPEIGFTFAEALRSFLRQDPDVILVGEIRDKETAEIAFKAANTGHLVLSTLHTNDAPASIARLLDIGIPAYLITTTVSVVVAQRLAGRVCQNCAAPHKVDDEALLAAGAKQEELSQYKTMKGEGCSTCNNSGIKGRVAIYEVMQMSNPLRETILRNGSVLELKHGAIQGGMRTLRQAALNKLKAGLIPLDQVLTMTVGDDQA